jgi:hypothetical protein
MISFFCKTYRKELEVASYAARSIAKYCTDPFEIVIVADDDAEVDELKKLLNDLSCNLSVISYGVFNVPKREGYVDQQCVKLSAHKYCSYENIFFFDSDMMFWREFGLNSFSYKGALILPFAEWPRLPFLTNKDVRDFQIKAGRDIFFLGDLENFLRGLSSEELCELGYSELISDRYSNVLIRNSGEVVRWQTNYPDLLWSLSSRLGASLGLSNCYFDTMREHYMVHSETLRKFDNAVESKFGSIWSLAYDRNSLPIFSEFQLLGNFIVANHFIEDSKEYYLLPYFYLHHGVSTPHDFKEKIPVIKFNAKNHPIDQFLMILNGSYSHLVYRSEVRAALGGGWN